MNQGTMSDEEGTPRTPSRTSRGRARPSMGGSGLFGAAPPPPVAPPPSPNAEDPPLIPSTSVVDEPPSSQSNEMDAAITQLEAQNANLRSALSSTTADLVASTAAPVPPIVGEGYVLSALDLSSIIRTGRLMHLDGLVRTGTGAITMLNPESPGIVHMTREGATLSSLTEHAILSAPLGVDAPNGAPVAHHLLYVLLAQQSLNNPGRAATILSDSPFSVAASNNPDAFVLDAEKTGIGRVAIIDDGPVDQMIQEIGEAFRDIGGNAMVVRNRFALGFGLDVESAMQALSTLEANMQRHVLR